jgi:hypothetical protein
MVVRKTLQWIATLLLLAGVAGGGYSYWFFTHSDEQLRAKIYEFVGKKLPNARLEIGRAWFWGHKVHLQNVLLSAKGLDEPLARCAEIVVTLDGEELSDQLRIDVRAVHVVRPDVRLIRDASGHWNWEKILPLPEPDDITPEVDFDDLQIGLQLTHSNAEMAAFHVQQGGIHLIPSAHKVFQVQADLRLPTVGDIHLDGGFDLEKRTWRLSGGTENGTSVGELMESLAHAFPDTGERLAAFEQTLRSSVRTASRADDAAGAQPGVATGDSSSPRFSGLAKIQFEVRRDSNHDPLIYKVLAELAQGEIEHPLLPFGLHAVAGKIFADNSRLILRNVEAQNGTTHLDINGEIKLPAPAAGNRVDIKVTDLPLDGRLLARLPPGLQRLYNMIRPAGQIDAAGSLVCAVDGGFEPIGWTFAAKHGSLAHEKFPYPITDVDGTGIQRGSSRIFDIDLHGKAGSRPVHLTGRVIRPGPECEADFEFDVQQLPVDDVLLSASAAQLPLQRTLNALNLRGLFDVHARFHRPAGHAEKIDWWLDGRLTDGSLEYDVFPYRITDFTGRFSFESPTGTWKFDELKGRHGPARLWGAGSFVKHGRPDPGTLKLDIGATDVPIERDFEQAFPEYSRKMWDLMFPSGTLKTQVSLTWHPGSKPQIDVPLAVVNDGSLEIRSFPYPLDHVNAQFAYGRDPGSNSDRILIFAFQAQHDETRITIDPRPSGPDGRQQSFILCPPADDPVGEWRIHLQRMHIDALNPDQTLRRALPTAVRNTVNALNPRGKVSLDGMLELRGTRRPTDPVTAAWSFETILSGQTISTGIELTNVHGSVKSWGLWDGRNVSMGGRVDLYSMYVFGTHQFTFIQGPFELNNQDLIVGSRKAFTAEPAGSKSQTIDDKERMTARFVNGAVLLDATAHLDADKTRFRVKALLRNANLGEYARLYMPREASLRGVMNGWVDLSSNTPDPKDVTGRGQLLIHPAALYELPVFVQIFKAFSFLPPDNTAFNYALTNFTIGRRQFDFREIDLIGDAISLRGKGRAGFNGTLDLDFYSRPAGIWQRSNFKDLANMFGQGWIGVQVKGTVQQPQTKMTGAPQMNEAFRRFLEPFNQPPMGVPMVTPPWMNSPPMMPMGNNPQTATATH